MPNIIEWPRAWWGVVTAEFQLMPKSQRSASPWRMNQNVYGPHVQWWQCTLQFPMLNDADLARREGLIESLGGSAGLLRMGHPFRKTPMFNDDVESSPEPWSDGSYFDDGTGWLSGRLSPTIHVAAAASARTTSVIVGGLPVSTSRVLRRGDLVEFRRNGIWDETPSLHRVIRDAATNSDGEVRIEFTPPLRAPLAFGDQVVLDYPMTVFRLSDDGDGGAQRNAAWIGNHSLNLVEALI